MCLLSNAFSKGNYKYTRAAPMCALVPLLLILNKYMFSGVV